MLTMVTGMRTGEIQGLRVQDLRKILLLYQAFMEPDGRPAGSPCAGWQERESAKIHIFHGWRHYFTAYTYCLKNNLAQIKVVPTGHGGTNGVRHENQEKDKRANFQALPEGG